MNRRLAAGIALTAALALTGCKGESSVSQSGVLQADDLPATAGSSSPVETVPPIGSYCDKEFGGILGPSFDPTGVEYSDVAGATITSLTTSNPEVGEDRIPQIRQEIQGCADRTSAPHRIEVVDVGDTRAAFRADAYPDAQAPAGEVGIARVKRTYVIVAISGPGSDALDLSSLLDKAVQRVGTD